MALISSLNVSQTLASLLLMYVMNGFMLFCGMLRTSVHIISFINHLTFVCVFSSCVHCEFHCMTLIDFFSQGLTSHTTLNGSYQRRSSLPISFITRSSAVAEGLCNVLVSRNLANETSHLEKIAISK